MNKKIEILFREWYETQCKNDNRIESSFIYDGSLSDKNLESHKILFVCRESHDICSGIKKDFWVKNVVWGSVSGGTKYYNCMNLIAQYIGENISLKECAYMNINKKGGNSKCDFKALEDYAKKYKNFITKEIEILNPKCIVILGKLAAYGANTAEDIFIEYGKENNIDVYIYDRHPCYYSKDIAGHIYLINNISYKIT